MSLSSNSSSKGKQPVFMPLYKQVEEQIKSRILNKEWKPGDVLPNEFSLADEFGVSQGTVRKSLNALTMQGTLIRRQGVGTFVAEQSDKQENTSQFPIVRNGRRPEKTEIAFIRQTVKFAGLALQTQLKLDSSDKVLEIVRKRIFRQQICAVEYIYLPLKYFPELSNNAKLPDDIHQFLQTQYSMTIHNLVDEVRATPSNQDVSQWLGVKPNTPLIEVTRICSSLDETPFEYRLIYSQTDNFHYRHEGTY
ncbi:GntR family transcriptional regulator [Aestuariibacter sp. AA17]|uniref:GntR family transcriptional regulator n=1 Tax=Fluctibacter corallii TaxID=2984329 RepID=A0ABT3AD42_9ALTE|nr:GntR family transcriptional regulator [Aestuariibacter sp. AA17]MCV2886590.1 GntR family transcriptional regulator [Aestuariibacter sp. AA17]